ncbi:MAG: OadG family protein [Intestinibacillus sp.]
MGITSLTAPEALLIALSGFVVVFIMLGVLSLMIVAISKIVGSLSGNKAPVAAAAPAPVAAAPRPAAPAPVQLTGVDDLTAACIMAIVSDETGIPLSELVFKHIKAV